MYLKFYSPSSHKKKKIGKYYAKVKTAKTSMDDFSFIVEDKIACTKLNTNFNILQTTQLQLTFCCILKFKSISIFYFVLYSTSHYISTIYIL